MKKLFSLLAAVLLAGSMMAASLLSTDFTEGLGEWTIDNVELDGLEFVWAQSSQYGMKATGYVSSVNHATEAWLISPVVDMSASTEATMSFSHARKFGDLSHLSVLAKAGEGEWTALEVSAWPDGSSWNYIDATADLSAFVGQAAVQVAFKYTSTAEGGATWEIKTVAITDNNADPVDEDVVIFTGEDFLGQGTASTGSPVSATKNGVTFTCNKGYSDDANKTLRCYKNGVITITSETEQIGMLKFKFYSTYTGDLANEVVVNTKSWTYTLTNQARIEKLSVHFGEAEQDTTPVVVPDTISVDSALVLGAALADKAYTDKEYVVEGYVLGAEDFDFAYKNQSWLMADSATAETSIFKAFRCIPVYNNDTVKVLNGDKVRICGKIQKYGELIEISRAKAEFISMVEGDHSAVAPVQEELDTITVARALEIGEALEAGKSSDSIYVIAGYVSKIITAYDTATKNESFWMVDTMGSRAASNAAGAFEVYRGKMDTIAEQDAMVYVKAKIYKYQPMKNNQPNGDPVIETANNPIPEVHVAEAGHAEVIESINVARAMEIGLALPAGSTSGDRFEITGYVSSIETPFDEQYKNETFWITDDSTSTANSTAAGAFYVYRGKPNTQAEIGMHAKIKIVCYIMNYSGKIENDNANNAFEVLKQGEELKYDTISVADAITKTQTLDPGATSSETYVVKGYLVNISDPYSSQYKNMSFYIDDEYPAEDNKFQCYRASIADTDVEKAVLGAYVAVTGKLDNNSHGLQMASGAKVEFLPAPQIDTIEVTVAQAVEVAAGLEPLVKTADWYAVTGYVSELESEYNEDYGTQSFWLANEKGGVNAFHAFQAKLKMAVAVGQEVVIFGKIMRFDDPVLETIEARMEGGRVTKIDGQDQGVENIVLTEKAQKVLVEGQIFIIRDNKLYNLQGARVR